MLRNMSMSNHIGHESVRKALISANASETVHHAYLFAGPRGVGKHHLARAFIAMVNCIGEAPTDDSGRRIDGCGTCRSCRRLLPKDPKAANTHPDLLTLTLGEGERALKIEAVRDMRRVVPFPPIEAAFRFVLIDPAEALTPPAANALLKVLEEPPSRTRFIVISSQADALLTTIRSRCQRITFSPLQDAEVAHGLVERFDVDGPTANAVAAMAEGSLGTGLTLLDDPVMQERDTLLAALAELPPGAIGPAFELASELAEHKASLRTLFDLLRRVYRDALLLRVGADSTLSLPGVKETISGPFAARYGERALMLRLELINETERGILRRNLNLKVSLERLVIALTAPPGLEGARTGVVP
jgi:DNA polymerase III subunit delta'